MLYIQLCKLSCKMQSYIGDDGKEDLSILSVCNTLKSTYILIIK